MRFDDILNSNQEKIAGQILLLNQQSDQFTVTRMGPWGNAC
jgi:hypothetical protein